MAFFNPAGVAAGAQALGAITSAFGQHKALSQGELAARQYETQMNLYKNQLKQGPGWEVYGLKAAGINPMLRYGKGGSMTGLGTTSATQPQFTNRFAGTGDVVSSALDVARTTAETKKIEKDTQKIGQDIKESVSRVGKILADTHLSQQQRKNAAAEAGRIIVDIALKTMQGYLTEAQRDTALKMLDKIGYDILAVQLNNELRRMTNEVTAAGMPAALAEAKTWGGLGGRLLTWVDNLGRGFNPWSQAGARIPRTSP